MREGIVEQQNSATNGVQCRGGGDDNDSDEAAQGCRRVLAAQEERSQGRQESVGDTKRHYQHHGDGGGNGEAGHCPGASGIWSQFGLQKLPEPGGVVQCPGSTNSGKSLILRQHGSCVPEELPLVSPRRPIRSSEMRPFWTQGFALAPGNVWPGAPN